MNKKAFTLVELLAVVVIIGILAAIVLPKFNKITNAQRTLEAERVMGAIRTEQEARCTLGKYYVGPGGGDRLSSLPAYQGTSFSYALTRGGVTATSMTGAYILQIPSYADGRICCSEQIEDGSACEQLNKHYPTCAALTALEDYVEEPACIVPIRRPPPRRH